jgi:hypothetical protein
LGTIIDDDLCRSPIGGLSDLERLEVGLEVCACAGCSDSEELEAMDDELDMAGDMLERLSIESTLETEIGSG